MPRAQQDAITVIHEAWTSGGRPIVPFLAAGLSAGAGFPLIDDLRSYLLKVKFFIQQGVYRHSLGQPYYADVKVNDPEHNLSTYIRDFGWPDINRINHDLYTFSKINYQKAEHQHLSKSSQKDREGIFWIDWIKARAHLSSPQKVGKSPHEYDFPEDYAAATSTSNWGRSRWRLSTVTQHVALEDLRMVDEGLARAVQDDVWKLKNSLRADWSQLLMDISEGSLGLIDSLFASLSLRFRPGMAHAVLANLVRRLGIQIIDDAHLNLQG